MKEKIDCYSGKKLEDGCEFLKPHDTVMIDMVLSKPIHVENFSYYSPLDHFSVYAMRQIIAVSIIKLANKKAAGASKVIVCLGSPEA